MKNDDDIKTKTIHSKMDKDPIKQETQAME